MNISDIDKQFDQLLEAVDLQSVFFASLVEKFIPVLPSYILFPAIGMGASDYYDLVFRCLVATIGSIIGAIGWYSVGASIGEHRVRWAVGKYGKWIFLSDRLYERMSTAYRGKPFRITVVGQLIPNVRIFQALPAGVLRLPIGPFLFATAVGALCWIIPLAGAGYALRQQGWSSPEIGAGLFVGLMVFEGMVALALIAKANYKLQRGTGVLGAQSRAAHAASADNVDCARLAVQAGRGPNCNQARR